MAPRTNTSNPSYKNPFSYIFLLQVFLYWSLQVIQIKPIDWTTREDENKLSVPFESKPLSLSMSSQSPFRKNTLFIHRKVFSLVSPWFRLLPITLRSAMTSISSTIKGAKNLHAKLMCLKAVGALPPFVHRELIGLILPKMRPTLCSSASKISHWKMIRSGEDRRWNDAFKCGDKSELSPRP